MDEEFAKELLQQMKEQTKMLTLIFHVLERGKPLTEKEIAEIVRDL